MFIHRIKAKPAKIPAATRPSPYVRPISKLTVPALLFPPAAAPVGVDPPKPLKIDCDPVAVPVPVLRPAAPDDVPVADMVEEMVDELTRVGSEAPQGLFSRQALWQALLP